MTFLTLQVRELTSSGELFIADKDKLASNADSYAFNSSTPTDNVLSQVSQILEMIVEEM